MEGRERVVRKLRIAASHDMARAMANELMILFLPTNKRPYRRETGSANQRKEGTIERVEWVKDLMAVSP